MHRNWISTPRSLGFLVAATVGCLGVAPARSWAQASAQEQRAPAPTAPAEPQPAAIIKKESRLVLVDAVVTDKKGNYVHDLAQKDFKVFEDNKEQQIASFSAGARMASLGEG